MAYDKVVDSGVLDAGLGQIADAIRAKGGTSAQLAFPAAMAAAIAAIEAGGGGGWTDNYTVFATGTFTPTEDATEWSIDTGVPYSCYEAGDPSSNYSLQSLIGFREQDKTAILGMIAFIFMSPSRYLPSYAFVAIGSAGGNFAVSQISTSTMPFPKGGSSIWNISGLASNKEFKAGKPYRWMLLGVLK